MNRSPVPFGFWIVAAFLAWYLVTAGSETVECVNRRKHSIFPMRENIWSSCVADHAMFPFSFFR